MNSAADASRHLHFALNTDLRHVMPQVESIEAFLCEAGCSVIAAQQLTLVAEEILTNIAREAWAGGAPGHCSVDVRTVSTPNGIEVSLRTEDDGVAFDPLAAEAPDIEAALDDREIGGLGILLIKSMTDSQTYQRSGGRNIFEIRKLCPHA